MFEHPIIGGEIREHNIAGTTVYEIIFYHGWLNHFTWQHEGLVYTMLTLVVKDPDWDGDLSLDWTLAVIRSMIE